MNIMFHVFFTHVIDRNTVPGGTAISPKDLDPGA